MKTKIRCQLSMIIFGLVFASGAHAAVCKPSDTLRPLGDGCVEPSANLLWSAPSAQNISLTDAQSYCATLPPSADATQPWRLPTASELVHLAASRPDGSFTGNLDNYFWSSDAGHQEGFTIIVHPIIGDKISAPNSVVTQVMCAANTVGVMRFIAVQGRRFAMQETETTRGQWKSVMGKYPEELPSWNDCYSKEKTVFEDSHPVSCVSWNDANDFARKMNDKHDGYNYRLPTEEEWGYTAGNIEVSTFGWCDTSSTQPVGKLKAHNGLYDMVGNVWEWTSSLSDYDYSGSGRVMRGGSWGSYARNCRSAYRDNFGPGDRDSYVGFRLVRTRSP